MAGKRPVSTDELEAATLGLCNIAEQAADLALRLSGRIDCRPTVTGDQVQEAAHAMRSLDQLRDAITTIYVAQHREAEIEARLAARFKTEPA